ncbi:MAG: hypothetical protein QOD70_1543 [Frankiales bacterium]|jgi:hypothetical protein|nr:hypothetical protein [Frankiales bacterium]
MTVLRELAQRVRGFWFPSTLVPVEPVRIVVPEDVERRPRWAEVLGDLDPERG